MDSEAANKDKVELIQLTVKHLEKVISDASDLLNNLNTEMWLESLKLSTRDTRHKSYSINITAKKELIQQFVAEIIYNSRKTRKFSKRTDRALEAWEYNVDELKRLLILVHQILNMRHKQIEKIKTNLAQLNDKTYIPSSHSTEDPLAIFPLETWTMLLCGISDVSDIHSCSNACSLFSKVLSQSKPLWQFELVVPILAKYLKSKEILILRQVSQGWRNGVDHFLENSTGNGWSICVKIKDWTTLQGFHRNSEFHRLNKLSPFPGRSLIIADEDLEGLPIGHLFREYITWSGAQVWSFCFSSEMLDMEENAITTSINYFCNLRDCLLGLPNLRNLTLDTVNGWEETEYNDNVELVTRAFERLPFPNLPHLQSLKLEFHGISGGHEILARRYSAQLVKVELQNIDCICREAGTTLQFDFSNLTELVINQAESANRLRRLVGFIDAPQLKILKLVVHKFSNGWSESESDDDEENISGNNNNVAILFEIIHKFQMLKHVKFLLDLNSNLELISGSQIVTYAPKALEILEIEASPKTSFSILLRFPCLKHLYLHEVKSSGNMDSSPEEIIDLSKYYPSLFTGVVDDIDKCNIWDLLPALKEITCQRVSWFEDKKHVYTRPAAKQMKPKNDLDLILPYLYAGNQRDN